MNPEYSLIALLLNYPELYEKVKQLPNIYKEKRCRYIYSVMKKQVIFSKATIQEVIKANKAMTPTQFEEIYEHYFEEDNLDSYVDYLLSRHSKDIIIDYASKLKRTDYTRYDEIKEDVEKLMIEMDKGTDKDVQSSAEIIEEMQQNNKSICELIPSGIKYIDRHGGFENTDFVIIAARPSVGKTSYALNLIGQDIYDNRPVGFFTVETHSKKIMSILACIFAGVEETKYRTNNLTDDERTKLGKAFEMLSVRKIFLDATPKIQLRSLKRKAKKMVKENGVKKIYIDYLQLINHYDKRIKSRYELITYISQELKELTRELEVPVICLAQLNRSSENTNREPRKSDLKESGAIEQDADEIILLHPEGDKLKNIVDKYRNGPQGSYYTAFNKKLRRIRDYG